MANGNLSTTVSYNTTTSVEFSTSVFAISSTCLQLKPITSSGFVFSETFDTSTGFIYTTSQAEFVGGVCRQIDAGTVLTNATFGISFDDTTTANFADGSDIGTLAGLATLNAGLILPTSTCAAIYDITSNADFGMQGTVRFEWAADYTGFPPGTRYIFNVGTFGTPNSIYLAQLANGTFRYRVYDNAGAIQVTYNTNAYTMTSGQFVEFSVNVNFSTNSNPLFFDGTLMSGDAAGTGSKTAASGGIWIGNLSAITAGPTGTIRKFVVYDTQQHTVNYTPGYTISGSLYPATTVQLPTFTYSLIDSINSWNGFVASATGALRYSINDNYYNGSTWTSSDGTYTQAASAAAIAANIANLTATANLEVDVFFPESATILSIENLDITYTGFGYDTSNPSCVMANTISTDGLTSLNALTITGSVTGSDSLTHIWEVDGVNRWHNGTGWTNSAATLAESNTVPEINSYASTLVSTGSGLRLGTIFHSDDGSSTPIMCSANIQYSWFIPTATGGNECIVYGWLRDSLQNAVASATVEIINPVAFKHSNTLISEGKVSTITGSDGYWEASLLETDSVDKWYNFRFIKKDETMLYRYTHINVLDTTTSNFNLLI